MDTKQSDNLFKHRCKLVSKGKDADTDADTDEGKVAMCCMDWGAKHPVGYADARGFKNTKDYLQVFDRIKDKKKGFELKTAGS